MLNYKKTLIVFFGVLFLFITGCSVNSEPNTEISEYVPVETIVVKLDTISSNITLGGLIEPNKTIPITSTIAGRVKEVFVSEGDYVTKNQELFSLDKSTIESQLINAEQALNTTYSNYKTVSEQVMSAQKTFDSAKQLYDKKKITEDQFQQVEYFTSNKPIEIAYQTMVQAQKQFEIAKQIYDSTIIKASDSGFVSFVNVHNDGVTPNNQPAMVILDMDKPIINLEVSENYINKISINDIVQVWIPAADYSTSGKIISVSSMKNLNSMLYPIRVMIPCVNKDIKASMYAEVFVDTDRYEQVIAIPSESIFVEDYKSFVYIIKDDIAYKREVNKAMVTNELTIIDQGLTVGDTLVVKGQFYLSHGCKVKVVTEE